MKGVNDMKLKRCEMNTRMMFARGVDQCGDYVV